MAVVKDEKYYEGLTNSQLRKVLNKKQQLFCDKYLIYLNATKAAKEAGYSEASARQSASEILTHPYIKVYLKRRLEEATMTPQELKKIISDVATGNMSEYLRPVTKKRKVDYEFPLSDKVKELEAEISLIEDYLSEAGRLMLLSDAEADAENLRIVQLKKQIVKTKLILSRDPGAVEVRKRDEEFQSVELDLEKIMNDKEHARVKSFKWSEFGAVLELQDAADAQKTLLKIHGEFVDRVESKNENTNYNVDVAFDEGEEAEIAEKILKDI